MPSPVRTPASRPSAARTVETSTFPSALAGRPSHSTHHRRRRDSHEMDRYWQRAQHDGMHERENCRCAADAQCEGQDRSSREDEGPPEGSKRVAHFADESTHVSLRRGRELIRWGNVCLMTAVTAAPGTWPPGWTMS